MEVPFTDENAAPGRFLPSGGSSILIHPRGGGADGGYDPGVLRALALDFNGVLVNDEPVHLACFQRSRGGGDRARNGGVLGALSRLRRPWRLRGDLPRSRTDDRSRAPRAADRTQVALLPGGGAAGRLSLFPGAADLVREAAAELPLVIVSGALRSEIAGALRQEGLTSLVRRVIAAEDVTCGKPDPEGYRLAIAALNGEPPLPSRLIHPHEVLAIEDSPAGVASASEAGLRTLAVGHSYACRSSPRPRRRSTRSAACASPDCASSFPDRRSVRGQLTGTRPANPSS
ncbi:MAG: HAD family phosphatase [Thermoanaerobaculia bacterium]